MFDNIPQLKLVGATAIITLTGWWVTRQIFDSVNSIAFPNSKRVFHQLRLLPYLGRRIDEYLHKKTKSAIDGFYDDAITASRDWPTLSLPEKGNTIFEIQEMFEDFLQPLSKQVSDLDKVSGNIYIDYDEEFVKMQGQIMAGTAFLNPMHNNTKPVMARMEANLLDICRKLFYAPDSYGGSINHGGSTSIFEAVKTYTFYARNILGIEKPNIIVASSVHIAFYKAAECLDINIIVVDVDKETYKANVAAMERKINRQTILLVGSAPEFMTGTIDPITELARVACKYNIGFHVDACLGGFLTAFADKADVEIEERCDFRVNGVTSISADLHKYGGTVKGVSVLLLGNINYRKLGITKTLSLSRQQIQAYSEWPGGFYVTKTLDGSRSLTPIASSLATIMYLGRDYYVETLKKLVCIREKIEKAIRERQEDVFENVKICGRPKLSILAFGSTSFKTPAHLVATKMKRDFGWDLNLLQHPERFHICLTKVHCKDSIDSHSDTADKFLNDLKETLLYFIEQPEKEKPSGMAELYCSKAEIPVLAPPIMEEIAKSYINTTYSCTNLDNKDGAERTRHYPFLSK